MSAPGPTTLDVIEIVNTISIEDGGDQRDVTAQEVVTTLEVRYDSGDAVSWMREPLDPAFFLDPNDLAIPRYNAVRGVWETAAGDVVPPHTHPPSDLTGYGVAGGYLRSDGSHWVRVQGVAYGDLTGVPSVFPPAAHTHPASDIVSGTFADALVAESNVTQHQAALDIDWSQVFGTPTTLAGYGIGDAYTKAEADALFAPIVHRHGLADIDDFGVAGGYIRSDGAAWQRVQGLDYGDLTNVPATFPPGAHTHPASEITGGTFGAGAFVFPAGLEVVASASTPFILHDGASAFADFVVSAAGLVIDSTNVGGIVRVAGGSLNSDLDVVAGRSVLTTTIAVSVPSIPVTSYIASVISDSTTAHDLLLVGVSGVSNGFTIQYDGALMQYGFSGPGVLTVGTSMAVTGDIVLAAGAKLRLDGDAAGDTYLYQSAPDVFDILVGGSNAFHSVGRNAAIGSTTTNYQGANVGSTVLSIVGTGAAANNFGRLELVNPVANATISNGTQAGSIAFILSNNGAGTATQINLGSVQFSADGAGGAAGFGGRFGIFVKANNAAGLNERFRMAEGTLSVTSGTKIYVDGVDTTSGDTYFWESSANQWQWVTGGTTTLEMNSTVIRSPIKMAVSSSVTPTHDLQVGGAGVGSGSKTLGVRAESINGAVARLRLARGADTAYLDWYWDATTDTARMGISGTDIISTSASTWTWSVATGSDVRLTRTAVGSGSSTHGSIAFGSVGANTAYSLILGAEDGATNSSYLSFATSLSGTRTEGLRLTKDGNVAIAATKRLYLDGTTAAGDTYISESSANTITSTVGGTNTLQLTSTTATVTGSMQVTGSVGVGLGPNASIGVYIRKSDLTSTDQYGLYSNSTFTSVATNSAVAIAAQVNLAAAVFNVGGAYGVQVFNAAPGAGATMSAQYGVRVMPLSGASSNWAFFSGANDWAIGATGRIFMDGGGNTYIYETSADVFAIVAGGVTNTTFGTSSTQINVATLRQVVTGSNVSFLIVGDAGRNRDLRYQTAGSDRWYFRTNANAESGSNAGSDFDILAFNDAGALIDSPLSFVRAAGGAVTTPRPVVASVTTDAGYNAYKLSNSSTGTSAYARILFSNNVGSSSIYYFGSGYTTSGLYIQDSMHVEVTGVGGLILAAKNAAGIIRFATGATPTERAQITAAGQVLVGSTTSITTGGGSHNYFQVHSKSAAGANTLMTQWSADAVGAYLTLGKSRSAVIGTYTAVTSGDVLGRVDFTGADGTDLETVGARVGAVVEGTVAADKVPTRLGFFTQPGVSANDLTEGFRITSAQDLAMAPTKKFYFDGTTATGDTYATESSANNLALVVGGTTTATFAGGEIRAPSGRVIGGTSSGLTVNGGNGAIQAHGTGTGAKLVAVRWSADTSGGDVAIGKSRSTSIGSFSIISSGDSLGSISFVGDDGGDLATNGAIIIATSTGTIAANKIPTNLRFFTAEGVSADDAAEKFRISYDGHAAIISGKKLLLDGIAATGDTYIYENGSNTLDIVAGGVPIFRALSTIGRVLQDFSLEATKRLYLDGGSNTYVYESSGDVIALVAGGTANLLVRSTDVIIPTATKLYLDGGTDTFIYEQAANLIAFVAQGVVYFFVDGNTALADGDTGLVVRRKASGTETAVRMQWKDFSTLAAGDKVAILN